MFIDTKRREVIDDHEELLIFDGNCMGEMKFAEFQLTVASLQLERTGLKNLLLLLDSFSSLFCVVTAKTVSRTRSVTRLGDLLNFGQFLRPLATINLTKTPTFLGNFCKGVEIIHFSSENIFGRLLYRFGDFYTGHTAFRVKCILVARCNIT